MSVFPAIQALLNKIDTPERLAQFQAYGVQYFADADFLNLLRDGMLELYNLFQLSGGRRISKVVPGVEYTIQAEDYDRQLLFYSDLPVTVTVPAGLDMNIVALQMGNGQITFVGGEGVTVSPPVDSYARTELKGAIMMLVRVDQEVYRAIGKLELI